MDQRGGLVPPAVAEGDGEKVLEHVFAGLLINNAIAKQAGGEVFCIDTAGIRRVQAAVLSYLGRPETYLISLVYGAWNMVDDQKNRCQFY